MPNPPKTAQDFVDDLCLAVGADEVRRVVEEAFEYGFRVGFEHAVAGGDEASKKHGIPAAHLPLVLYFKSEEDRRGMADACIEALDGGAVVVKIPERKG